MPENKDRGNDDKSTETGGERDYRADLSKSADKIETSDAEWADLSSTTDSDSSGAETPKHSSDDSD